MAIRQLISQTQNRRCRKLTTTRREISLEPADVCDSPLLSNVRQTTLVTVFKRVDRFDAPQSLLQFFNAPEDLISRFGVRSGRLGFGERGELVRDDTCTSHAVEHTSEEGTLLRSYLRCRCVGRDFENSFSTSPVNVTVKKKALTCTIADSPDVLCTFHDEILVHFQAALRLCLRGDLAHEVFNNRAKGIARGPNQQAVRYLLDDFIALGIAVFSIDVFLLHVFDHGFGANVDSFFSKSLFGIVNELFGEHGEDLRCER